MLDERHTHAANSQSLADKNVELADERIKRVEAERIGKIKDEFLANLSHEIRTPLNAILGWAELLKPGQSSDEEMAEGLEVIRRNARAQAALIDDLLDMSRIVSGKLRLEVERVNLATAVTAAVEVVHLAAEAKGVQIEVIVNPVTGPVSGDRHRVQQMLWNLLSNAIKFTPRGGKVQVVAAEVNSHIELSVIDTGQGIDPDYLPHVFERFSQGDASANNNTKGLGLGLAIVKNLAELHGGSIRAQSEGAGRGSSFIISLPISLVSSLTAGETSPNALIEVPDHEFPRPDLAGVHVMVVVDDKDGLDLVKRALTACNARVTTCKSSEDCLKKIPAERPMVLISDIGMPGMDGYALIKALRALPESEGGRTPAIALTAHAGSEDARRAVLNGFDVHIARPAEPGELLSAVARLVGGRYRHVRSPAPFTSPA